MGQKYALINIGDKLCEDKTKNHKCNHIQFEYCNHQLSFL